MSIQSALGFLQTVPASDPKFPSALLRFRELGDLVDYANKEGFDFGLEDLNAVLEAITPTVDENRNEEKFSAKAVAVGAAVAATNAAANTGIAAGALAVAVMNANNA